MRRAAASLLSQAPASFASSLDPPAPLTPLRSVRVPVDLQLLRKRGALKVTDCLAASLIFWLQPFTSVLRRAAAGGPLFDTMSVQHCSAGCSTPLQTGSSRVAVTPAGLQSFFAALFLNLVALFAAFLRLRV